MEDFHSKSSATAEVLSKRKRPPCGAFAQALVDNVSKVREQVHAMTTLVTVPLLEATEQLLYQLEWEYHEWRVVVRQSFQAKIV